MKDKLQQEYKNYKVNLEDKSKQDYPGWLEDEIKFAQRRNVILMVFVIALLLLSMAIAIWPDVFV